MAAPSVDHKSLLFDLCDNLRTPFVPRIQLLADHQSPDDDEAFGGEPNGDGLNGYTRMRMCDFIREYVGGSKPAILQIDDDLLTRLPAPPTAAGTSGDADGEEDALVKRPDDPASYPQPAQLGVYDADINKYHWAVRWHCNEYLAQKVRGSRNGDGEGEKGGGGKEPNVTVALTPNGRADAITRIKHYSKASTNNNKEVTEETYFASAAEVKMPMSDFFALLAEAQQNSDDNDHTNNMTHDEEEASMGPKADYHRFVDLIARCEEIEKKKKKNKENKSEEGGITIYNPVNNTIPYIQLQNSSLSTEYAGTLHSDVPSFVKAVGQRLFGAEADAENLWIGSHLSTTTMHQDWYENLYWVVRGTKTFTLIPPWEAPYLKKRRCRSVAYEYVKEDEKDENSEKDAGKRKAAPRYTLQPTLFVDEGNVCNGDDGLTEWISTDFIDDPAPTGARDEDTRHQCHPATASVHSGEVLYLPAMWFHGVEQSEEDEEGEGETAHGLDKDSTDHGENEEEEEEELNEDGTVVKKARYFPKAEDTESEAEESCDKAGALLLSPAAARAPCVIAVNYWFEMNCGGPMFWIQEMLKGMFPQPAALATKKK